MNASLQRWGDSIGALSGWRRNMAAFFMGVMATFTLAPFYVFVLLIPAFTGLFWLIESAPTRKRMFADGWWWGWGFYISGLYWFCIALLTEPEKFAWLIPFTLFGLNAVIALYSGIACWLMSCVRVRGLTKIIVFTGVYTLIEYARGHLFSGFPWNLPGYSFGFSTVSLQPASLIGIYGLTWCAVLLGTSFAALREGRRGILFLIAVWGMFAAGMGWGHMRLEQANAIPESQRFVPGVKLRLVQADIEQAGKWDPQTMMSGLRQHVTLMQSKGIEDVTHVIWPETAVPYILKTDTPLPHMLGEALPEGKYLLTGTLRSEGDEQHWQIWNSLAALDHEGNIIASYDKTHLVPFGEFLPFRSLFPKAWLTPVGDTDFSRGEKGQVISVPGLPPFMPLICYEVIFPEFAQAAQSRPAWFLSVTNDAWFGMSTGPRQHYEMARMRAVEQGIPLVRVANTGISGVIDSYGRVLEHMDLGTRGVADVTLPLSQTESTIYGHYNNLVLLFLMVFTFALMIRQRLDRKN